LDAETSNSTYADKFKKAYPDRFFEMFIAEQNMISAAVGLSKQGLIPFCSSFAAFLTRSFDQIRMAQYCEANIKIVGSHAGVSIGPDGASQMGLEDLAMARSILESVVFYPSDAVSTFKLTEIMACSPGLFYLRTTREKTPVIYSKDDELKIGGSKILFQSNNDKAVVFTAGITLHEAIKAYHQLKKQDINIAIVDLYSIKPLDKETVNKMVAKTKQTIIVEDHYPAGGLGEAIKSCLFQSHSNQVCSIGTNIIHLCVKKIPHSATMEELLRYEEIDAEAISKAVSSLL
jgi:transketolase